MKSRLIGKDPDAEKIEDRRRRWQQKMVGQHHRLNGHEFEQTSGDSEGQEAWHAAVHSIAKTQT